VCRISYDEQSRKDGSLQCRRQILTCRCFVLFATAALGPTTALLCSSAAAFSPVAMQQRVPTALPAYADEVDQVGNNIKVKDLLEKVQDRQLLSKVAASGLLSKAQKAGITLSNLEPLLALAAENPDILILVEASGPELLAILPGLVDLAPGALPLLAAAVSIPAPLIGALGVVALAAAGGAVVTIPDDTTVNVAIQTLAVGLSVPLAGASFAGAAILGKLTK
jgi:hypothetical protein